MASKRRKKGRPRKTGPRHRNGHLKRTTTASAADSPRLIAASQPHRRGLGELALDPAAENELGRMWLHDLITEEQRTAGEVYARMWRGYVSTLAAPSEPGEPQGRVLACNGCSDPERRKYCACDLRRRIWAEATRVLGAIGPHRAVAAMVDTVVLCDRPCPSGAIDLLKLGLSGLAEHYGLCRPLTNHTNRRYRNARSPKHVAVTP